jgi:drug/metabolite transporter (DMT)-like permease
MAESAPIPVRDAAAPLSGAGLLLLAGLTLTWGVNWPMMKIALVEIPPWTFRSICLMVGGGALLLLARLAGQRIGFSLHLLPALALTSFFNITGWHLCSAYALLYTGSGRASIIGFTMPIWVTLLSSVVLGVRPTTRQIVALVLGMAALGALIAQDLSLAGVAPLGALLMAAAAASWGMGTLLVKRFAWGSMPIMTLTGWQQIIGGLPIVVGWWFIEPVPDLVALSPTAAFCLAYAALVAGVFSHTAYFKLVALLPAHVAAIGVLAVPVVGVISSAVVLGEAVSWVEIAALVLVVGGLFLLINRPSRSA